jgi:regulator of protease activity HflC (stomatin/prohibitin superfamily)
VHPGLANPLNLPQTSIRETLCSGTQTQQPIKVLATDVMGCCVSVPNDKIALITRCGKFTGIAHPGFQCVCCPLGYSVAGYASIRVQEVVVTCETKTKDNVFVNIQVAVQYEIIKERVYEAFYMLENPQIQISAYVFDVVRAAVPGLLLDEVFESKEEIASQVKDSLLKKIGEFGYKIHQALVTDITPAAKVKDAMNEINASKRLRQAATEKAEAEKLLIVKNAEAEAESMFLQGQGIARQRKAIMDGLKDSVGVFQDSIRGSTPRDVLELVLITQYFDTLRDISNAPNTKAVFTQGEGSSGSSTDAVRMGFLQARVA